MIDSYFAPELHAPLHAQVVTNQAAFQYSLTLVEAVKSGKRLQEPFMPYTTIPPSVRDQGFRRAVVSAYAHRCAFCSIRMRTPDGHTAVDAAHIIPWSVTHNDDPHNGTALDKNMHVLYRTIIWLPVHGMKKRSRKPSKTWGYTRCRRNGIVW